MESPTVGMMVMTVAENWGKWYSFIIKKSGKSTRLSSFAYISLSSCPEHWLWLFKIDFRNLHLYKRRVASYLCMFCMCFLFEFDICDGSWIRAFHCSFLHKYLIVSFVRIDPWRWPAHSTFYHELTITTTITQKHFSWIIN